MRDITFDESVTCHELIICDGMQMFNPLKQKECYHSCGYEIEMCCTVDLQLQQAGAKSGNWPPIIKKLPNITI